MAASNHESSAIVNAKVSPNNSKIVIENLNTELEPILRSVVNTKNNEILRPLFKKFILIVVVNPNYYSLISNRFTKENTESILNDIFKLLIRQLFAVCETADVQKVTSFLESVSQSNLARLFGVIVLALIKSKYMTPNNIKLLNKLGEEVGKQYIFGYISPDSDDEENGWYSTWNFYKMAHQSSKKRKPLEASNVPPQEDVDGLDESLWKEFVAKPLNRFVYNEMCNNHQRSTDQDSARHQNWRRRQEMFRLLMNRRARDGNSDLTPRIAPIGTRRTEARGRTNSRNSIHTNRNNNRGNYGTNYGGSASDNSDN